MDTHADSDGCQSVRKEFADGLECFRKDDYAGALPLFRAADKDAEPDDRFQSRYTSFHGLVRVHLGDSSGIKLCRKAAAGEIHDAVVYYNLAMLEHRLNKPDSAWTAVRRGLRINPAHAGLQRLKKDMRLRARYGLMPGLSGSNPFNRLLGKLRRGRSEAQSQD
jgi:hypothetical protein